jgi:hypothetical protein
MEHINISRDELIEICKNNNINGYSGLTKQKLINLIKEDKLLKSNMTEKINTTTTTNYNLFEECLKKFTIKEISNKLNICIGTIK